MIAFLLNELTRVFFVYKNHQSFGNITDERKKDKFKRP